MEAEKKGGRAGNKILKSVFPSAKYMKSQFPYLRKAPFLLPVAWLNRILKYRKEISAGYNNSASDSIKIGNERVELMREYGIIGKQNP